MLPYSPAVSCLLCLTLVIHGITCHASPTRISRPFCVPSFSVASNSSQNEPPSRHVRLTLRRYFTDTSSPFLVLHYLSPPELTCASLPRYNGDELIPGGGDDLVEDVRDGRNYAGRHVARAAEGGKEDREGGQSRFQYAREAALCPLRARSA